MSDWNEPKFSLKQITIVFLASLAGAMVMTLLQLLLKK